MNKFRATLREKALAEIVRLEKIHGENSFDPELVEARRTLWAFEFADDTSEENRRRLEMTAVETHPNIDDTSRTTKEPGVFSAARVKAIGASAFLDTEREKQYVGANAVGAAWDGAKMLSKFWRNDWNRANVLIVESATGEDEIFSILSPENLLFTDINDPTNTFGNGGVTDYNNEAARPIRVWYPEYMRSITAQSHFQGTRDIDSHKWNGNQSPNGIHGLVATRPAVNQHKPYMYVDSAAPAAPASCTVKAGENCRIRLDVFVASGQAAGIYECPVTVLDSAGSPTEVIWRHEVADVDAPNADPQPFLIYHEKRMLSDFVNGRTDPVDPAQEEKTERYVDRYHRITRQFNGTPITQNGTTPTPTAGSAVEARLLGGAYSGAGYLGRNASTELPIMMLGAYNTWPFWSGVNTADPATVQPHIDGIEAWIASSGFGGQPIVYLADEQSRTEELVEQNHLAGYFPAGWLKLLTAGSSNDDPNVETVWRFLPTAAMTYPNFNLVMVAANALPKSLKDIVQAWKAARPGAKYGPYNGHSGCDYSVMLDDDVAGGQVISGFGTAKLTPTGLFDYYFRWQLGSHKVRETGVTKESLTQPGVYDRFVRPIDGLLAHTPDGALLHGDPSDPQNAGDPRIRPLPASVTEPYDGLIRFNPWKTAQSIGTNDLELTTRRATNGDAGHLISQCDGVHLRPGECPWWESDAPGVERVDIGEAMFGMSMRQSIVLMASQARLANDAATQAICDAVVPDGMYSYEAGTNNDNYPDPSPNQEYSYNGAPRALDTIPRDNVHTGINDLLALL